MNQSRLYLLKFEVISWLITIVLFGAIIYPIINGTVFYPFLTPNIVFVLTFLVLTRFIFLLPYTFLRYLQWAKVIAILACIPLSIYIVQELHSFEVFADEIGVQSLYSHLTEEKQANLVEYTKAQMLLFGVGSLICTIVFPFRMLISFWRTHNLGTT